MKIKKEDLNYAARIADGMSQGSNKPVKPKKKYKYKTDVSTVSGMSRPYYEEDRMENKPVAKMLMHLLEEIEEDKKSKKTVGGALMSAPGVGPTDGATLEEGDNKLMEDYRTIKLLAQKGINEVSNGHDNKSFMQDIVDLAKRHASMEEVATELGDTTTANRSTAQVAEAVGELQDAGKNNPTE